MKTPSNQISLRAVDWAGNVAVTNYTFWLDHDPDRLPGLQLLWPTNGTHVYGDNFNVHAWIDDNTATIAVQCLDNTGEIQTVRGWLERDGNIWIDRVPLHAGTNHFALVAGNWVGNTTNLNFTVIQSSADWTVTPLTQDDLKYGNATVRGTVADPGAVITVNGIQGTNDGNGNWAAPQVPLPPGGTVALQVMAHLTGGETVQTLLTYIRDPIVFTQRYAYKLDTATPYWVWGQLIAWETSHFETHWARGEGGADVETLHWVDPWTLDEWTDTVVTTWPPDNGYWPCLPGQQVSYGYHNGLLDYCYTNPVPAPAVGGLSVEWMEESNGSGWVAGEAGEASYAVTSGRQLGLFTGGQGTRQSQNLLGLSAALTVESQPDPDVGNWPNAFAPYRDFSAFLQPASPPVAVPAEQVNFGTVGSLGSDRYLWTVQSDGRDLLITPRAPGAILGPLPQVEKYKPYINAHGEQLNQGIVVSNAQFCVGQHLQFSLGWTTAPPYSGAPYGVVSNSGRTLFRRAIHSRASILCH